ncbi:MAG: hypothetical protein Q8922_02460 [Bacteroidota bacterium]|nr:hypothetical protein [Bacteroidota bacterium]MDP4232261.1 hypothetical protein [Bacteroidota bacterium]MDP4242663.1 hypothetical protein [Bacteroidota bacterium]MDP4286775.1 hypothetical protein [Bacteroidota bacterium]
MPAQNRPDATSKLIQLLTPYHVPQLEMDRWGPGRDGGYVVPVQLLRKTTLLVTGGVCDDVQFEEVMARENPGVRIGLFDHTITKIPSHTPATAVWHKMGLGSADGCIPLESAVTLCGGDDTERLVVKLDIENAEWDVIENTPADFWRRVDVFIIEIHGLGDSEKYAEYNRILDKLNQHLLLVHVHGNNFSRPIRLKSEGVEIPVTMEATYINRSLIPEGMFPKAWRSSGPTKHDRKNNETLPDIRLNYWMVFMEPFTRQWVRAVTMLYPWRLKKNIGLNWTLLGRRFGRSN